MAVQERRVCNVALPPRSTGYEASKIRPRTGGGKSAALQMVRACVVGLVVSLMAPFAGAAGFLTHGPFLGHTDHEWSYIWARFTEPGKYKITCRKEGDEKISRALMGFAEAENDNCVVWTIALPEPDSKYFYTILTVSGDVLVEGPEYYFQTPPAMDTPQVANFAVGSCANDKRFKEQPAWAAMQDAGAQGIVLLGDTPYIDSTDLEVQRTRYREFYEHPDVRPILQHIPFWGTWDDHDFGKNNTDGNVPGKENSRKAFTEYHPMRQMGLADQGVFTSFRQGPIEFILLDTRWAAGTEPSMWDEKKPGLLGNVQWQWLTKKLIESTAPFKVICSGMVWNDAVPEDKPDCWARYPHEREALFKFLGLREISGVVLMSGDIHWSRAMHFDSADTVGYDLTEIVASPIANTLIESFDIDAPEVLHSAANEHSFVLLTADDTQDPPVLHATCQTATGETLFEVTRTLDDLSPKKD